MDSTVTVFQRTQKKVNVKIRPDQNRRVKKSSFYLGNVGAQNPVQMQDVEG